ncbi:glycosyltransferase [Catenovulum maritimum]|uniref:glycosyltransferase n=1 Tax=Catenovulum maritimum TaxID=1513271 RepID=UPI00065FDE33|nr:glycosyltransferase [Catenovulum maritimum]
MNILFVDWAYKGEQYNLSTLKEKAVGGSESTLIKVATELAKTHKVFVNQYNCVESYQDHGVRYINKAEMNSLAKDNQIDVCIVMRKTKLLNQFVELFQDAKILLWAHDFLSAKNMLLNKKYIKNQVRIISVSLSHMGHSAASVRSDFKTISSKNAWVRPANWPVSYIYNPIENDLKPDDTEVDKNKLVFFSSPHKGLSQVLAHFQAAKKQLPDLRLLVANPGYRLKAGKKAPNLEQQLNQPGVELIGGLPQHEIIQHVRSALCVFYPQSVFPETFGLIYAEAHAVGTPVLAHDFGSASELLLQDELVDAHDQKQVLDKLINWHNGHRPKVALDEKFRMANVIENWHQLLNRVNYD